MAKILPFARGEAARTTSKCEAAGEILIFPGVRVEYHDGPPQPTPGRRPQRGGRRSSAKDDALSA